LWTRKLGFAIGTLLLSAAFAVLAYFCLYSFFSTVYPDCKPGQPDGQCGLGTFLAELMGFAGAAVAWPICSIGISMYWYPRLLQRWAKSADST
jgi:hypothetical protein